MPGMTTSNSDALIRSELWSSDLKEVLRQDLMANKYVNWMTGFGDGNTFTIPSIGELPVRDYTEGSDIQIDPLATGEFQFSITEYVTSGTSISDKNKQDSFYSNQLISKFVPSEARAIAQRLEADILKQGQPGQSHGQTVSNANEINGADHRWVAQGTSQVMAVEDFAKAMYSLKKANVPQTNLIAIVDPSVEYTMNTLTNLSNVSNNPRWEGIIDSGIAKDMRFVKNIYGFDVYTSNFLPKCGTGQDGTAETIDSVSSGANARCNVFFSASQDILPYIGAWRQMPRVETERKILKQEDIFITTARYGLDFYRPENFVTVLSQVPSGL